MPATTKHAPTKKARLWAVQSKPRTAIPATIETIPQTRRSHQPRLRASATARSDGARVENGLIIVAILFSPGAGFPAAI